MDWDIQDRHRACCGCERAFDEGERYHGLLRWVEAKPLREDFCHGCWEQRAAGHTQTDTIISMWQAQVKPRLVPVGEPIKRTVAENLLRKYLHAGERYRNVCFILALILERKKVLVPKEVITQPPDGRRVVYLHTGTDETLTIEDPQLTLAELDTVRNQVQEVLEQERVEAG